MITLNLVKYYNQYRLRKYYQKIRLEALEAERNGDKRKYFALNAIADRLIDKVLY